ncbi:MAG: sulfatase [Planctomycetota bacterium]
MSLDPWRLLSRVPLLSGVILAWLFVSDAQSAERNIVLVVADDHGCDAGCYGNPVIKTPSLDALAADGVVFDRAFCTTASCSASRSVILTGLHNHANGHYGHQHTYHKFSAFPATVSLPEHLRRAGYRTGRAGKYHVAPAEAFRFDRVLRPAEGSGNRNTVALADGCRKFIAARSDQPYFLYYCTSDPHRGVRDDENSPYKPNLFGNEGERTGVVEVQYEPSEVIVPDFLPDTPECRAELAEYYQSVSRLDQGVGRLIKHLKDTGHWEDTLFVYISDHGIAMAGAKTTLYEPGMRSPCIARDPYASQRGFRSQAMVSWVDLTPTLLDFAQIDTNDGAKSGADAKQEGRFHGRSFLPLLDQSNAAVASDWNRVFGSHTFHEVTMYYPMRVVREDRFKLIWNIAHDLPYPFASDLWASPTWQAQYRQGPNTNYGQRTVDAYVHRPEFELYDLAADPGEANNLAGESAHADVLQRLKADLKAFQQRTVDPWVLKWDYE